MAAGLYGFRVKVDASGITNGLRRKFILHIDYVQHKTIGDIVCSVQNILKSKNNLILFVGDYYLPASESIHTLRDGDDITVFYEAAFNEDTSNIAEPGENNIEYSEWKEKKKYKVENSKYEKKQKRKKYKTETLDSIADLSNIKGEYDNEMFNPDTRGNLESEQGSMLVNCSSLLVSLDKCQSEESFKTSVKAPEIETSYEHKRVKTNKEEKNLKQRKREESLDAAQKHGRLKRSAVSPLLEVFKVTKDEVVHAFTCSKTNEQIVKQDNTLYSPDVLDSKKGAVPWTENKTEKCVSLGDKAADKTKDLVNSSVSQSDAWFEKKRKRKRTRTNKKSKVQKLDSHNNTPVKNFASSEIKAEESQYVSRKHIRFADDAGANVEDSSVKVSASTAVMANLENSVNTIVTENVTAQTSEDPVLILIAQNSFTFSQENEVDKLKSTSLEQNITRPSTQWDVKPDVPDASAFSKLLSLGWSSTPLVYERKKPSKIETVTITSTNDETKKVENLTQEISLVNGHKEMNGMNLPADTILTTEKIIKYPALESSPRKKDILAFKILRMGEDYTPQLSDYIVAEVKHFCPDSQQLELSILQGADQCMPPKGKFDIVTNEKEEETNAKPEVLCLNWNELIDPRILYP